MTKKKTKKKKSKDPRDKRIKLKKGTKTRIDDFILVTRLKELSEQESAMRQAMEAFAYKAKRHHREVWDLIQRRYELPEGSQTSIRFLQDGYAELDCKPEPPADFGAMSKETRPTRKR